MWISSTGIEWLADQFGIHLFNMNVKPVLSCCCSLHASWLADQTLSRGNLISHDFWIGFPTLLGECLSLVANLDSQPKSRPRIQMIASVTEYPLRLLRMNRHAVAVATIKLHSYVDLRLVRLIRILEGAVPIRERMK